MRRAERLFALVQLIRGRRLSTAAFLAERLQVSARTVYRDVADLQHQGVPIDGAAGVGYRMRAGFDLPPLMFTHAEAQALLAAVRMARPRLDPELSGQAETALGKILAVLPPGARAAAERLALFAPPLGPDAPAVQHLATLRQAIDQRRKLALHYCNLDEQTSQRTVWPLGCFYWGQVWTLGAWCELRHDFRSFRIDRMVSITALEERFRDEPGRTLADLRRREQANDCAL